MKLTRSKEIQDIINQAKTFEEMNHMTCLCELFLEEMSEKLGNIGMLNAKLDRIIRKLNNND